MFPSILLFLLSTPLTISSPSTSSPLIFLSICSKNQTQNPELFDINFVDSMEKIFQNITASGFATSSSGANLTVFGLGQCFSYLSPISCQLCYSQSRVKLPHCLPSSSARIYLDGCFLEYSDRNVSQDSVDAADAFACGNSTVEKSVRASFVKSTAGLMGNLTAAVDGTEGYYRAGSVRAAGGLVVYGMVQCWRSLSEEGCGECLEKGRESIVGNCLPADEGKVMNAGCFLRYSREPFYLSGDSNTGGDSNGNLLCFFNHTLLL